jgi:hypothetical protein
MGLIQESETSNDPRTEVAIEPPPRRPPLEGFSQPPDTFPRDIPGVQNPPAPAPVAPSGGTISNQDSTIGYAPNSEQQPNFDIEGAPTPVPFGSHLPTQTEYRTQGGTLDQLYGNEPPQPNLTIAEQMGQGRNVTQETLQPFVIQAQQDQARQSALLGEFFGSRDSIVDRRYATSNTGLGQNSLQYLPESLSISNQRRLEGARLFGDLAYGQPSPERGTQIPGMPPPPDSTNPTVGSIVPGGGAPTEPENPGWLQSTTGQLSALGNFVGSLFAAPGGSWDAGDIIPFLTNEAPVARLGNSLVAGLISGGRTAIPSQTFSPVGIGSNLAMTGRPGTPLPTADRQVYENIGNRALGLGMSVAASPDINGGYRFDPIAGNFGAFGNGLGGAAMYTLSFAQNLVGASIYSIADAGLAANQALIGLPVVGDDIRRITNNAGADLVNRPEMQQFGYRFNQAFSGTDLSFTQDRDTTESRRANQYLNILDPKATGFGWWSRFAVGFALDMFTGGVDEIVRPGIRVARVGRVPVPYPSLRTSVARIGRPGRTATGQRIPFIETHEQVSRRGARELRREATRDAETLRIMEEQAAAEAARGESVLGALEEGISRAQGQQLPANEINGIPDPWNTPAAPNNLQTPDYQQYRVATVESGSAWFSNGDEALGVKIEPLPRLAPPLLPSATGMGEAAFGSNISEIVDADMAAFGNDLPGEVVEGDMSMFPPELSPEQVDADMGAFGSKVDPLTLDQDMRVFADETKPIQPSAMDSELVEATEPLIRVVPAEQRATDSAVPTSPNLRRIVQQRLNNQPIEPQARAQVLQEAVDEDILEELDGGILRYTEADYRESQRKIKRMERRLEDLSARESRLRMKRESTTDVARERIAVQSELEDVKAESGSIRRSLDEEDKALLDEASPVISAVELRPGMTIKQYLGGADRGATSRDLRPVTRTNEQLTALGKFLSDQNGKPLINPKRKSALETSEIRRLNQLYPGMFDKVGKPVPEAVLKADPLVRVELAQDDLGITTETAFVRTTPVEPPVKVSYMEPDPRFAKTSTETSTTMQDILKIRERVRQDFLRAAADGSEEVYALSDELTELSTPPGSALDVERFANEAPDNLKPKTPETKQQASRMLKAKEKVADLGQQASELETKIAEMQATLAQDTLEYGRQVPNARQVAADEAVTAGVTGVSPRRSAGTKNNKGVVNLPDKAKKAAINLAGEVNKMVWYHGTRGDFENVSQLRPNVGSSSNLDLGAGLYLTPNPKMAQLYARAAEHTEAAVDNLVSRGKGAVHEVAVNLDAVVESLDTVAKPILDELKQVVGLGNLTKNSTYENIWSSLRDAGVSALTFQSLSSEVAQILKSNGIDGIRRSPGIENSVLDGDLVVFDTIDGSALPAETVTRAMGYGANDMLDPKIARHQVDTAMLERYDTPYTRANELQSRLAVQGQYLDDLTRQYADVLRRAETAVGDHASELKKLQEMVEQQQRIVDELQQEQAPRTATRQAKRHLDTTKDSPCL